MKQLIERYLNFVERLSNKVIENAQKAQRDLDEVRRDLGINPKNPWVNKWEDD